MTKMKRISIAALGLSAAGLVSIVMREGYSDNAIIPVKGDVPTIGFGTTNGVKLGDKITPPVALARAFKDVQKYEGAIKKCVKVPLHQYEYDVYVDFSYNIGTGAFCGSTLVKKLNAEDYDGACLEIMRWTRFKGKDCSLSENSKLCGGLFTSRKEEYAKCIGNS